MAGVHRLVRNGCTVQDARDFVFPTIPMLVALAARAWPLVRSVEQQRCSIPCKLHVTKIHAC
jgi:hypothetical protein